MMEQCVENLKFQRLVLIPTTFEVIQTQSMKAFCSKSYDAWLSVHQCDMSELALPTNRQSMSW